MVSQSARPQAADGSGTRKPTPKRGSGTGSSSALDEMRRRAGQSPTSAPPAPVSGDQGADTQRDIPPAPKPDA